MHFSNRLAGSLPLRPPANGVSYFNYSYIRIFLIFPIILNKASLYLGRKLQPETGLPSAINKCITYSLVLN